MNALSRYHASGEPKRTTTERLTPLQIALGILVLLIMVFSDGIVDLIFNWLW